MKTMARPIVRLHFNNLIRPVIPCDHNSEDERRIIAEGVNRAIDDGVFLRGLTLDAEVNFPLILMYLLTHRFIY